MAITLDGNNLATVGNINSATTQNSTSGTAIDFTGIPAGVKRITIMFNGVSTNAASQNIIQLGAGSFTTTGYTSICTYTGASTGSTGAVYTTGFVVTISNSSSIWTGHIIITNMGSNVWICSSNIARTNDYYNMLSGGNVTLSGTLDRVRVTSYAGTDVFDAGSINILYE